MSDTPCGCVQHMKDMIKNHYRVRMVLDNMPVTTLDLEQARPPPHLLSDLKVVCGRTSEAAVASRGRLLASACNCLPQALCCVGASAASRNDSSSTGRCRPALAIACAAHELQAR